MNTCVSVDLFLFFVLFFLHFKTRIPKIVDNVIVKQACFLCFLDPFTWAGRSLYRFTGNLRVDELQGCGLPYDRLWLGAFPLCTWGISERLGVFSRTYSLIHYIPWGCQSLLAFLFTWRSVLLCSFPAWTHLSYIWEAKPQENHREPGSVPEKVQWNSVLGDHRDVYVLSAKQAGPASQEVHQDRSPVSGPRFHCPFSAIFNLTVIALLIVCSPLLLFHVYCQSCKEYRNLNTFFAIIMGLSNPAVSRLSQTWEVGICPVCLFNISLY